jgi:uncharacterized membrane protein YcfT
VDVAKGLAIVAVAQYHSANFLGKADLLPAAWEPVTDALATVRMPLFFMASGLFAASSLAKSWGNLVEKRLVLYLYLYVVWSVARFALYHVPPWTRLQDGGRIQVLATIFVWPTGGLWYLYALALFFVLIRLVARVPVAVQIGVAAVLSAAFGSNQLNTGNDAWDKMAVNLVFFLLGCHLGPWIRNWAGRLRRRDAVVLLAGYVGGSVLADRAELGPVPGLRLLLSVLAVTGAVAGSVWLARIPARWNLFRYLGERTLPIYLVHYLVAGGIVAALASSSLDLSAPELLVLPVALTMVVVVVPLALNRLLRGRHGVFDAPPAMVSAVGRRVPKATIG